jgi:hypothetical protein
MIKPIALPFLLAALAGCTSMASTTKPAAMSSNASSMSAFSQDSLPSGVQVPPGHRVAMETAGAGEITYQCREKQAAAGQYEWFFVGPKATLSNRAGSRVGTYYGPPATWESSDGSRLTGTQVAVAPAGSGNIAYQLVKANPAQGQGAMTGVTYIQRVATRGGVPPAAACAAGSLGRSEVVKYQADYVFWTAK